MVNLFLPSNYLERLQKWTIIIFIFFSIITFITRIFVNPLDCNPESVKNLTIKETSYRCLNYDESSAYINSERKIYQYNFYYINWFIILLTFAFYCLEKLLTKIKPKFRRYLEYEDWIKLSNENNRDNSLKPNECLQYSIDKSRFVCFKLYIYLILNFIIILLIQFMIKFINFISSNDQYLNLTDFNWSSIENMFPNQIKCSIKDESITIAIICYLKLNILYKVIYLTIWLLSIALFILYIIFLIQLILLTISNKLRFKRIQQILPDIDELTCLRLSTDCELFIKLDFLIKELKDYPLFNRLVLDYVRDKFNLSELKSLIYDSRFGDGLMMNELKIRIENRVNNESTVNEVEENEINNQMTDSKMELNEINNQMTDNETEFNEINNQMTENKITIDTDEKEEIISLCN